MIAILIQCALAVNCTNLQDWELQCTIVNGTDVSKEVSCGSTGYYDKICTPLVSCEYPQEIVRRVKCGPNDGKKPGAALCLSIFLGFFGVDRFYLGYNTIGVFKLLTGGFFGLGWYLDIFLIALRLVGPARNFVYVYDSSKPFITRLPTADWS